MRVPADDRAKPRDLGHQVQLLQIMQYVETCWTGIDHCRLRQRPCPFLGIDVPPYCKHGSNFFELCQYLGLAHVSRVHDQINSRQRSRRLKPQETVCIGNNSNSHFFVFRPPTRRGV